MYLTDYKDMVKKLETNKKGGILSSKPPLTAMIFTSFISHGTKLPPLFPEESKPLIIGADGGHKMAEFLGADCDYIIGDFDSSMMPKREGNITILPKEKDLSDTEAALQRAMDYRATDLIIVGGLGGRADHMIANIALLNCYNSFFNSMLIVDGQNSVRILSPGSYKIAQGDYSYISILSYSDITEGLTLKGFKYPLFDVTITNAMSRGISNELTGEIKLDDSHSLGEKIGELSFKSGRILLMHSKDIK